MAKQTQVDVVSEMLNGAKSAYVYYCDVQMPEEKLAELEKEMRRIFGSVSESEGHREYAKKYREYVESESAAYDESFALPK